MTALSRAASSRFSSPSMAGGVYRKPLISLAGWRHSGTHGGASSEGREAGGVEAGAQAAAAGEAVPARGRRAAPRKGNSGDSKISIAMNNTMLEVLEGDITEQPRGGDRQPRQRAAEPGGRRGGRDPPQGRPEHPGRVRPDRRHAGGDRGGHRRRQAADEARHPRRGTPLGRGGRGPQALLGGALGAGPRRPPRPALDRHPGGVHRQSSGSPWTARRG